MIPLSSLVFFAAFAATAMTVLCYLSYELGKMVERKRDPSKKVFIVKYKGTLEEIRKMREIMK